ncbi:MAG TPA: LuxR C-terminal-related transcriptional regulator, partial [Solirubrobacteraceae bacterium]
ESLERALAIFEELGARLHAERAQAEIMGRLLRARHFTHRGEVEVARADLERGLALAEALLPGVVDLLLGALGRLELAVGDAAAAHARLAPVTEHVRQREWIGAAHQRLVATDAEALVELGELDAARELADLLERQKALDEDLSRALTASLRGLIAAAAGDLDTAAGELRRSLAEHEQTRQPFNIAYTLLALGTVERRARRNVRARESLERALAIFEELGARLHAERAQAELARVGGRRPAAGKLTETERRVAELVARGKSNQEVARELYVSPKTVEWNLSKVYRKLMIRSRGELAAKLAGEGARKIRGTAD